MKNIHDYRLNISKMMALWLGNMGIELKEGVFFLKETIDKFVKLYHNPSECIANLKTARNGVNVLACQPCAALEIEKACYQEQAIEVLNCNCKLGEALNLKLTTTETQ